jgi:3-oxoacyl-[acyl-carrier protein] reductase
MDLGIRGRVAFVAASSKGLGRAAAEALAADGVRLALCSRHAKNLTETAGQIRECWRVDVLAEPVDVTDFKAVTAFLSKVREKFGGIDICVTNAGGPPAGTFESFSLDDWREAFEGSFMSTLHMIREVLPGMRSQRWGRIVTITSISVKQSIDGLILSNAIRASVVGLLKSLVREYGSDNVLFNNVCPGATATDRLLNVATNRAAQQGITREEVLENMGAQIPLGRVGQPEEFGPLVAFLCSERAAYITGTSTAIDGGEVRGT